MQGAKNQILTKCEWDELFWLFGFTTHTDEARLRREQRLDLKALAEDPSERDRLLEQAIERRP